MGFMVRYVNAFVVCSGLWLAVGTIRADQPTTSVDGRGWLTAPAAIDVNRAALQADHKRMLHEHGPNHFAVRELQWQLNEEQLLAAMEPGRRRDTRWTINHISLPVLKYQLLEFGAARCLKDWPKAISDVETILGPSHPRCAAARISLADVRVVSRDHHGASEAYQAADSGLRQSVGEFHPLRLIALARVAALASADTHKPADAHLLRDLRERGAQDLILDDELDPYDSARELCPMLLATSGQLELARRFVSVEVDSSELTSRTRRTANLLRLSGLIAGGSDSIKCLESAVHMESQLATGTLAHASRLADLASMHKAQGRFELAEELYLQALQIRRKSTATHAIAETLLTLSEIAEMKGEPHRAIELVLEGIKAFAPLPSVSYYECLPLYVQAARISRGMGDFENADKLVEHAIKEYERLDVQQGFCYSLALRERAQIRSKQGRREEALLDALRAVEITDHIRGEDHPDAKNALRAFREILNEN